MAIRKTKTTDNQTALAIDVAAVTSEVITTTPEPAAVTNMVLLPDLHAPALNPSEPAVSYKLDFSDRTQWFASRDGGKTKAGIGSAVVAGAPVDLSLQISKAAWGDGYDQRLRLVFMEQEGVMAELNVNAVNRTKDGSLYVTSPARSLVGGLLSISESEDDILALCDYARFTIKPGSGRGLFIELDIAVNGRWIAACSPANTNRVAKEPAGLHAQLSQIKQRFRGAGCLLTGSAITGEIEGYDSDLRLLASANDDV
jgi:hypothetical protein